MVPSSLTVFGVCLLICWCTPTITRVTLVQQQACAYQAHNREVLCMCREGDTMAYLGIRMQGFFKQAGKEIDSLVVQSCPDLILHLDLRGLNLTRLRTEFRNCNTVRIESIVLDNRRVQTETVVMNFNKIELLTISGVQVESAMQMTVLNVKRFHLLNSSFANIKARGLLVNGSTELRIRDCVFKQMANQSIVVERTRELEMVGNQFGQLGVALLSYRDSSSALIRCNRLVGSVARPECGKSSQPTVSSTDTIQARTRRYQYRSVEEIRLDGEEEDGDWLVFMSGIILLLSIIIYTSYMSYKNLEGLLKLKSDVIAQFRDSRGAITNTETVEEQTMLNVSKIPEPPPPPESVEVDTQLNSSKPISNGKSHVVAPIWLSEIQSNEIFNKQKQITKDSDDTLNTDSDHPGSNSFDDQNKEEIKENGPTFTKGFKEYVY